MRVQEWRAAAEARADPSRLASRPLAWIGTDKGLPYFRDEDGKAWTPVGHNEAVSWTNLAGLFRRGDAGAVERHFADLAASGVTCLRLMLEYAQGRHRYFERPAGTPVPAMVRLWDDLFALCERHGIRVFLTPFDTFWMARRWRHHPYARERGGPLHAMAELMATGAARRLVKARLDFVVRRWGGSGAFFAWDLMNEIHPALDGGRAERLAEFVHDLSTHIRVTERRLYGRSHPQTVSVFGPALAERHGSALKDVVFRHPDLDFATSHLYEATTIDRPRDTVAPALAVGRLVSEAIAEIRDDRPFLDSESGPIHHFNDRHRTLPLAFDEEYFRHMQWAHLTSGGAGGGLRWPYRNPHRLTAGMHGAQAILAGFCEAVDWREFRRRPFGDRLRVGAGFAGFGCGDESRALVWLLRTDGLGPDGMLVTAAPRPARLRIPGFRPGPYGVRLLDTATGQTESMSVRVGASGELDLAPAVGRDLAIAIGPAAPGNRTTF